MQTLAKAGARDGTGYDHRRLRGKPKSDNKTVAKKGLQTELVKAGCGRRHLEKSSLAGSPEGAKDTASRAGPRGAHAEAPWRCLGGSCSLRLWTGPRIF